MDNRLLGRLADLEKRIEKLEKNGFEDTLTLVEILANASFFGNQKMQKCEYAKKGQCSLFVVREKVKGKIPMVTDCRINDCKCETEHCHLEISNVTCAFCPVAPLLTNAHTAPLTNSSSK